MPVSTSHLLAILALCLALLSAVTVVPLWIAIVLLSLSILVRDRFRIRV